MSVLEESGLLAKHNEALRRAIPMTRLMDYGVHSEDAQAIHARTGAEPPEAWALVCEQLADAHAALAITAAEDADADTEKTACAEEWRQASALYQAAQLAFNADAAEKVRLYEQARLAMRAFSLLAKQAQGVVVEELRLSIEDGCQNDVHGELYGWRVAPASSTPTAAVILIGGLSGWGAAYLSMALSLARRGLLCLLAEGPGQGSTRLQSGLHLSAASFPLFSRFVDHAEALGARRIGTWGNSFGGLFAARLAVLDTRVQAVCINGAPMTPSVPGFRTAREQMDAVFGSSDEQDLVQHLASMRLDSNRDRINGAVLVVEGGRDSLVALGEQHAFLALAPGRGTVMTWDDGEHTIYNHAEQRNERISAWFQTELAN